MSISKRLIVIFTLGFLLRLLLIPSAYHGDLNNNISWGNAAVEKGLVNYFEIPEWQFSKPNQPPLYILLFSLTSLVWKSLHSLFWSLNNSVPIFPSTIIWFWEQKAMLYLVKLPSILADIGIAYLLYTYFKKNQPAGRQGKRLSLLIPAIWLFNPVTWYSSAIWGQTDAIINFIGLGAILLLLKKDIIKFASLFTAGFLFKGSLGILIPVILFVLISQKHSFAMWLKASLASVFVIVLCCFWFHPALDLPIWLANLYQTRILSGEIGDLTANAFNFWWLIDPGKTLDSTIFFGLQARVWGYLISLSLIGSVILLLRKTLSPKNILFALSLSALITFLFMTRIHERYLYPFFPLTSLLLGLIPSLAVPYIILSAVHLLNLYHLFWSPPIPFLEGLYKYPLFMQALALIHIAVFILVFFKFASKKEV